MEPENRLVLPVGVITVSDVSDLIDEMVKIDDMFVQLKGRQPGTNVSLVKTSYELEELIAQNKVNLLKESDRKKLRIQLQNLRTKSPVLHFSFSTEPSRDFLGKLNQWIRKNIDPYCLLQIGLQPSIGAGFNLRTTNKFFDFSLGKELLNQKPTFIRELVKSLPKTDEYNTKQ